MQTYREIHKNVILEEFNILYQSMTEFIGKNKDTKIVDENREKIINIFRICDCMLEI